MTFDEFLARFIEVEELFRAERRAYFDERVTVSEYEAADERLFQARGAFLADMKAAMEQV